MSMVDEVAKAIYARSAVNAINPVKYKDLGENQKNIARSFARAAIEAMREPTEKMMVAGWSRQFVNVGANQDEAVEFAMWKLGDEKDVRFLKEGWSAAIDAALNEEVK